MQTAGAALDLLEYILWKMSGVFYSRRVESNAHPTTKQPAAIHSIANPHSLEILLPSVWFSATADCFHKCYSIAVD